MASLQDIRRRIKSVKNIQQITKAMKMVAAARLRRAQESAVANKPYAEKMRQIVADVAAHAGDVKHPLLEVRNVENKVYLVLASDKGLAGAYASNVFKEVVAQLGGDKDSDLITVGRKATEHFGNRNYKIANQFTGFSEKPTYEHARKIAADLIERFTQGECDQVEMIYTHFVSSINAVPTTVKLLPFTNLEEEKAVDTEESVDEVAEDIVNEIEEDEEAEGYIYEPSASEVLGHLLPQYLVTMVYAALLQSAASELSARMTAMSNATDNAQELIQKLDLHYNKVRQAGITREISEIVSGAEALK